ncbi:sensor histidine kinase [Sphingobium mellinum]|uniref:sensor histidine kinase n=1 Tax=Sphingobium mellinum TaxID=1387166 RepID=UPI0030EEC516
MKKRQQMLADFGEMAMQSDDLDKVLGQACRLVVAALGTGRAHILEMSDDGQDLSVRAGVGWAPDVLGTARLSMNDGFSQILSAAATKPVIINDLPQNENVLPPVLRKAGIEALAMVPILLPGSSRFGILLVDSSQPRYFNDDDIQLLRIYATLLGPVIDRLHRVEEHRAKRWEERQKVLVAELQHRTRNLLAVVRSMAEETMRGAADLNDFGQGFRDRLEALARVQALLSRLEERQRVTFDLLIRTELMSLGVIAGTDERVTLHGPDDVRLRSSTVQTLALALHELATNAAKYGALSQSAGHLAIRWQVAPMKDDAERWLHIDWQESGVVMPDRNSVPSGTGQGRALIERALPYQLQAKTIYDLGSDGVRCTISMPLTATF